MPIVQYSRRAVPTVDWISGENLVKLYDPSGAIMKITLTVAETEDTEVP